MSETISSIEPYATPSQENLGEPIARFSKRLWALVGDMIILSTFGFILGSIFIEQFARMGSRGVAVGLIIALLYYGILNSKFGRGQTIAKRFNEIRVVDQNGNCISLFRSFLRTLILFFPLFIPALIISPLLATNTFFRFFGLTITAMALVLGLAMVYFYIFNHHTRQGIHDLICRTYVVRDNLKGAVIVEPVARVHFIILVIISVVFLVSFCLLPVISPNNNNKSEIIRAQSSLYQLKNVDKAFVFVGTEYYEGQSYTYVKAKVFLTEKPASFDAAIDEVARVVFTKYPAAFEKDMFYLTLRYGYNIGIAQNYENYGAEFTIPEWQSRLNIVN